MLVFECGGFIGELVAWAAGAGALGAAALDHEICDDAVEVQAVVEAFVDEFNEVGDGLGGGVRVEFDLDVALAGFESCNLHAFSPWFED